MKYICTIDINLPIDKVVSLWEDESNFHQWQDGFQSIEVIYGQKGFKGTKSRILLQQGSKKMELIETIIRNQLPREKKAEYEHIHMTNTQSSRFESITLNKTRYFSEVEYTKFNGFAPKIMAKIFPFLFKRQSEKWMNNFKYFAERTSER